MAESAIKVDITGLEPLKGLLDVLVVNVDKLPIEVTDALQLIAGELDAYRYDWEYIKSLGIHPADVVSFVNGSVTDRVIAGHPISKKVSVAEMPDIIAESFWIYAPCGFVCGWGEKPERARGGEIKGKLKVPYNEF